MMSTSRATPRLRSFCTCSVRSSSESVPRVNDQRKPSRAPAKVHQKPAKPASATTPKPPLPLGAGVPHTELFVKLAESGTAAIPRRPTLVNETAARELVREWGIDKMHDPVIIDAFAGPGGISRALLELKNVKRVISVEDSLRYMPHLQRLKDQQEDPSRLALVNYDPFSWEAYTKIQQDGLLDDVPKIDWETGGVHPGLFVTCQLPNNRIGEQLFFQFTIAISGKMWYYQYGRMQIGFTGANAYWNKVMSQPGSAAHNKLAVLIPALADLRKINTLQSMTPAERYFHKPRGDSADYGFAKMTPLVKPTVDNFDALEHVTRNMFISRTQTWRRGVTLLAPGASNLIPIMEQAGITLDDVLIRNLTMKDWAIIANVFDAWPFRPKTLFDEGNFAPAT
ncbi:hypothetical protein RQP46_001216 [Phenoliferia psychrophenolica]